MFEDGVPVEVRTLGGELLATEDESCAPAEQVDRIAGWERVIAHAQARQLAEMVDFADDRRAGAAATGEDPARRPTYDSVNDEIAMARGVSAVTAALQLRLGQILIADLPACFAALDDGRIGLHAARVIVAETDVLTAAQRRSIDAAVAAEAAELTPGQVRDAVRARVLAVDAAAADTRAATARANTYVGMVKRLDGVGMVFANLKAEDAVAVTETLDAYARSLRAGGDARSLNQIRVDTFVDRLITTTGSTANTTGGGASGDSDSAPGRRVTVNVVVSAATLLGLDPTPGMLTGYGHLSPAVVRAILDGPDTWVRRLVVDPIDGQVLTIDSRARRVSGLLRVFTDTRDGICRRPFCNNPIADADHIHEFATGGRTNHRNTDGLCEGCHLTRHRAGWTLTPETGTHRVWWTTPTGHSYPSDPPPAIGYGTLSHPLLSTLAQRHPPEAHHAPDQHQRRRTAA